VDKKWFCRAGRYAGWLTAKIDGHVCPSLCVSAFHTADKVERRVGATPDCNCLEGICPRGSAIDAKWWSMSVTLRLLSGAGRACWSYRRCPVEPARPASPFNARPGAPRTYHKKNLHRHPFRISPVWVAAGFSCGRWLIDLGSAVRPLGNLENGYYPGSGSGLAPARNKKPTPGWGSGLNQLAVACRSI